MPSSDSKNGAISACQRSGEFIERCLSHALSRHADRDWRSVPLGKEHEFLTWLEEQIPIYGLEAGFQDLGEQSLKNVAEPVRVYLKPERVPLHIRMFGWLYPLVD